MTESAAHFDYRPLKHRFAITPITEARARTVVEFEKTGKYSSEPIPEHILNALRIEEDEGNLVRVTGAEETFWLPLPLVRPLYFMMARGMSRHLLEQYQMPGFVEIEEGDTVVDCGAFAGGFSLGAQSRNAGRVIAVEPSPRNFTCLRRNVAGTPIECLKLGLADRASTVTFYERDNPTDSSVLPDPSAETLSEATVQLVNIPQLMRRAGIERIDFLKMEAEGLEPEALQTATPERVRKIAVAATPERQLQSPFLDIAVMLANRGYRLANQNYWLFARAD